MVKKASKQLQPGEKVSTSVRVTQEGHRLIEGGAKRLGMPQGSLVEVAVREFLARLGILPEEGGGE